MRVGIVAAAVTAVALMLAGPAQAAGLRAPTLQSPAAGSTVEALPTFSWSAVPRAARYQFQLAADSNFGSIVLGTGRGRGSQRTRNTAATLTKTVPDGTYYWRVRAITAKERSGRWSTPRRVTKSWATAPKLQTPANWLALKWPSTPLVLRWSPVPHATKYLVTVATDPSLAQSVLTVLNRPVETMATVFALQGTLPSGRYYWAITPVDAGGQRGTRSKVGIFTWTWPTSTVPSVVDLNDTPQVFDPLLRWNIIPGAARYEVEINPDDGFAAGSRVCCNELVLGTSLSPLRVLPNNNDIGGSGGYHWRVRAFDADGNPGQWNRGPLFKKAYDNVPDVPETIPGLHLRDHDSDPLAAGAATVTPEPVITWSPVPGAAQYQVQWTQYEGGGCGWTNASGMIKTSSLAWTPLSKTAPTGVPGGIGITANLRPNGTLARWGQPLNAERAYPTPPVTGFADGVAYCVRVRALSDDSYRENDGASSEVISLWTQLGAGAAFTYQGAPTDADPPLVQLPAPDYLGPVGGTTVTRTPLLRWSPVAGARRYFVLIARDSNFTNVIDAAFTSMPAYSPNLALEDEATSYFWAVIPSVRSNGSGIAGAPKDYNPQTFRKLSIPPTPVGPAGGASVATQPTFRWTPSESAQKYRIQVSPDPEFGDLLDDVVTASTAYTSQTPYPADTALYWRVRGEQQQTLQGMERVELRWSAIASFRRRLPAPSPLTSSGSGELIPVFSWTPVPGAVSYDLHVDEADGDASDFTMKSAAFTATKFFGTGIYRWKVRANFAARIGSVSSAYAAPRSFTRVIAPPRDARVSRTRRRMVFSWTPVASPSSYRVEVSASDSFAQLVDSERTDNTSWAPDLESLGYVGTGPLYWRVASVDGGGNVGAFATGPVRTGKKLRVKVSGKLRRGKTARIRVTVRGSNGKALRGATVSVKGAGVRAQRRKTGRSGKLSFLVRPSKLGTVTIRISRAGYAVKTVSLRVK
ncbi:MAG: hypothetical protein ACRDKY_03615 [Solirubrobacteraceae bacterium]